MEKADVPIEVTLDGIVIDVSASQSLNILSPITVRPLESVTLQVQRF